MNKFEELKSVTSRAEAVSVKSILNSTLWTTVTVCPVSWIAAYFLQETFAFYILVLTGLIPVLLIAFQTIYFSLKDPDRLQNEDFLLGQKKLDIVMKGNIKINDQSEIDEVEFDEFENLSTKKIIKDGPNA